MKLPKDIALRCLICFSSQLFSFFLITANFRAIAQGLYFWTAVTDVMIVIQGLIITKLLIEDENARDKWSIAAFSIGGACGSLLSIWVTKHLFGA